MQTNPDVPTADLQTMCGPRDNGLRTRVREADPPFFRPVAGDRPPADRQDERDPDDDGEQWDAERWDGLS